MEHISRNNVNIFLLHIKKNRAYSRSKFIRSNKRKRSFHRLNERRAHNTNTITYRIKEIRESLILNPNRRKRSSIVFKNDTVIVFNLYLYILVMILKNEIRVPASTKRENFWSQEISVFTSKISSVYVIRSFMACIRI